MSLQSVTRDPRDTTRKGGTRRMPRAQRERSILDIAGQVFAHDGYHSASMDEIARAAGVSKPMLYAYFESKQGLYLSYIERSGAELVERLQRAFAQGDPATVRVRERVGEFLSFVQEHGDGWRVLFGEASANRPVAESVAQMRARIVEAVRRLVEAGLSEPVPAQPAAEVVAHAIVGAGESLANWWLEHPEVAREDVAAWYAEVVRACVVAVAQPGPGAAAAPAAAGGAGGPDGGSARADAWSQPGDAARPSGSAI